jgi:hypothetical protein
MDNVPDNFAPLVAAHASLACYLAFKHEPNMIQWQKTSFKKVVCRVSESDFKWLKLCDKIESLKHLQYNVTTESALGGAQVAITFCPEKEFPKFFKDFKLWNTENYFIPADTKYMTFFRKIGLLPKLKKRGIKCDVCSTEWDGKTCCPICKPQQ